MLDEFWVVKNLLNKIRKNLSKFRKDNRGFSLLIVISGLSLLISIFSIFTFVTKSQVRISQNIVENARAEAYADAAVVIFGLKLKNYIQGQNSKTSFAYSLDGKPGACILNENAKLIISLWDETGKIDLNGASLDLLKVFFSSFVASDQANAISSAIIDFRDTNNLILPNGAEKKEYKFANLPYGPKNSRFETIEELEQVLGMNNSLYQKVLPFLTVYTGRNGVDPKVVPTDLTNRLSGSHSKSTNNPIHSYSTSIPQIYAVNSYKNFYRMIIAVETKSGGRFVRDAVIEFKKNKNTGYKLRRWQRANWPDFSLLNSVEKNCLD